jgi:hypothetical protein
MVVSFGCWSGTISCDPITSKDPCWSSFHLSGGGGGSSVTGGAHDPPLCEKIKDTLGLSICSKNSTLKKVPPR